MRDDSLIGRTISGYRILERIDGGGDSGLYVAEQLSVGRKVALEVATLSAAHRPSEVSGFVDALRQVARLNHPGLVRILDVSGKGALVFYSMEYLSGGSLDNHVQNQGPLPWSRVRSTLVHCADALAYAAAQGLCHGDLEPSHLLISESQRVKVLFAGRLLDRVRRRKERASPFRAPELRPAQKTIAAGIYSLGACAAFALTGQTPEAATNRGDSWTPILAGLPPAIRQFLSSLLHSDPAQRPRDYSEVSDMASSLSEARLAEWTNRDKAWLVGGGVMVIFVVIGVLWMLQGDDAVRESEDEAAVEIVSQDSRPIRREEPEIDSGVVPPVEKNKDDDASLEKLQGLVNAKLLAAASEDLRKLEEAWASELPSRGSAVKDIEKLGKRLTDLDSRIRLKKLRRLLLKRVAEWDRAETALDRRLKESSDGDLRASMGEIAGLRQRFPDRTRELDEKTSEVRERAGKLLESALVGAATLVADGKYSEAIESLDALQARLPPEEQKTLRSEIDRWVRERDAIDQRRLLLTATRDAVHKSLKQLDFAAARRELKRRMGEAGSVAAVDSVAATEKAADSSAIEREIQLVEETWNSLIRVINSRSKDQRFDFTVLRGIDTLDQTGCRLRGVKMDEDGAKLDWTCKGGKLECSLLEIHEGALLKWLGEAKAGSEVRVDIVEGLGLLLWARQGPGRALRLLTRSKTLPRTRRTSYRSRMLLDGTAGLEREIPKLRSRLEKKVTKENRAEPRDLVAAVEKLAAWYGSMQRTPVWNELKDLYLHSQMRRLREADIGLLFHGKTQLSSKGILKVTYDFSDAAQARDFFVVGTEDPDHPRIDDGQLRIDGECRFMRGNVFRDTLSVTLIAEEFSRRRPNVNIALWTQSSDAVTYQEDPLGLLNLTDIPVPTSKENPNDYVVFSLGYEPDTQWLDGLVGVDNGHEAEFPCVSILGGARGKSLHSVYAAEQNWCIWAQHILRPYKAPQKISIRLSPKSFVWAIGRSKLNSTAYKSNPDLLNWLKPDGASGSITLFSNHSKFAVGHLRVEGRMSPWWLEEEIERNAADWVERLSDRFRPALSRGTSNRRARK